MAAQRDNLAAAVRELGQILAGGENLYQRLGPALAAVEEAVGQHEKVLEADGPRVVDIESPRIPSPVVTRQVGKLQAELEGLRSEVRALRQRLTGGERTPDVGRLRERARQLLAGLGRYDEEEAQVIQETVNTDVGAGD
jgi:hypothetical protein